MSSDKTISVGGVRYPQSEIKGLECVFATYAANHEIGSDMLVVKEKVHFHDGRVLPNVRLFKDKKWPFYVTKEGNRNHECKKEWEDINKLQKYTSTRINLTKSIARTLGYGHGNSLRRLSNSPYLYGTDILPSSLIKMKYRETWKDVASTEFVVAALDVESNISDGEINMVNICMAGKSYTSIVRSFCHLPDDQFITECHKDIRERLGKDIDKWSMDVELEIVDNPGEAVYRALQKAHEWMPDFISIWNMNFDIPKMQQALEKNGYDVAQAFSHPSVPREFQVYEYIEGPAQKKNQEGKITTLQPAERWHTCTCTASFYFVDAMCLYKRIRTASGNEPSYALNAILNKHGLDTKLVVPEVEHLSDDGPLWHHTMQTQFKIIYVTYNLKDDIAQLDLDEETGDVSRAFNMFAGVSDYANFVKQPRKIVDDLHGFVMDRGKIIASTPEDISREEMNKYTLGLRGWIVALPSYMIDSGGHVFHDAQEVKSLVYRYLADLDVTSTYPTAQMVLNISKETTMFETYLIRGMTEQQRRELGILLVAGKSSGLEVGIKYFGMPSPQQLINQYRKDKALDVAA